MQKYKTGNTPLIMIQGSFSNGKAVPKSLNMISPETESQSQIRRYREVKGYMVDMRDNCSTSNLLNELKESGYELVDAFCQERVNPKDPTKRSRYWMVRYVFANHENAEPSTEFVERRSVVEDDLQKLLSESFWRIRVFLNPFFKNNEQVSDCHTVSINLEARKPRFQKDGQLVVQWKKDNQGNRVGEAAQPLQPDIFFHISNENVSFMEA
ncbi:MAG: hypothetical protein WA091_02000 [Minisyncoccales bacterium]